MNSLDTIPEFKARPAEGPDVGIANLSAFSSGPGIRSTAEVLAIILVAVVIIGGAQILLQVFEVPEYILPKPKRRMSSGTKASIGVATRSRM